MVYCGIEIKGSDAVPVVLEGVLPDFSLAEIKEKKISLKDSEDQESVAIFYEEIKKFFDTYMIESVGIKKRNTKGRFAGGAASFKIEGLIQLAHKSTKLIAPATILKSVKSNKIITPENLLKYQLGAFETCLSILPKK